MLIFTLSRDERKSTNRGKIASSIELVTSPEAMPEQLPEAVLQQETAHSNNPPPQQVPAQVVPPYNTDVTHHPVQPPSDVIQTAFLASTMCGASGEVKDEATWATPDDESMDTSGKKLN